MDHLSQSLNYVVLHFPHFQDGETIDYTWTRVKTNKNYLKLKSVEKSDTGVFICRGVNGFGSVKVRVELIVTGGSE